MRGGEAGGSFVDLFVSTMGTGKGTITGIPVGIQCGSVCTAPKLPPGTVVTLSAAADFGSLFAGWSGGGCSGTGTCTVTVNADTTVTATFDACSYSLDPTNKYYAGGGGLGSTHITTADSCQWNVTNVPNWITVTSGISGTGSGWINYSVVSNTTESQRTGSFNVGGQTFTITQGTSGSIGNNCAATLANDLSLHIPILTYDGYSYWADFSYVPNTLDLNLINADLVTDTSPFNSCSPSTLSLEFKLHIPAVTFDGNSYWMDMIYSGQDLTFTYVTAGQN